MKSLPLLFCFFLALTANTLFPVVITTLPNGADLYSGGEKLGKAPFATNFSGELTVTARMPGYDDTVIKINGSESKTLVRLMPTNSAFSFIRQLKSAHLPKDLLFTPDGRYLMAPCMGDPDLSVFDMKTETWKKITLPRFKGYVAYVEGVFAPDGKEYWFTQLSDNGKVLVLSMEDWTIREVIPTRGDWTKVGEFSPDGKLYYVSNWLSDDITVIDRQTRAFIRKIRTEGKAPRGVGFSLDGRYLYVVFYDSGEIMKFDLHNGDRLVKKIKNGGTNGRFRVDPIRKIAYVNNMHNGRVYVYDLTTDTIIREFTTGINPNNVKISPDRRYVYVSNRGPNHPKGSDYRSPKNGEIMVFDAENGYRLVETIPAGNQPIGVAISPDGKILAVSNFMDDTIDLYRIRL